MEFCMLMKFIRPSSDALSTVCNSHSLSDCASLYRLGRSGCTQSLFELSEVCGCGCGYFGFCPFHSGVSLSEEVSWVMDDRKSVDERPEFLPHSTSDHLILQAIAENHSVWNKFNIPEDGVRMRNGATWTVSRSRAVPQMVLFPELRRLSKLDVRDLVDEITSSYFSSEKLQEVIWWDLGYYEGNVYQNLEATLLARGWERNWNPCWMVLDVPVVDIETCNESSSWEFCHSEEEQQWTNVIDMPYYNLEQVLERKSAVSMPSAGTRVEYFWVKCKELGQVVGHCVVIFTYGPLGVGGVFSFGVLPTQCRKGVGSFLLSKIVEYGHGIGCPVFVLNATPDGEFLYRKFGFRKIGDGKTWLLRESTLQNGAMSKVRTTFVEACLRGDLVAMDNIGRRVDEAQGLAQDLPNGLSLMELVSLTKDARVARELLAKYKVKLDFLSAWDLGMWDEALNSDQTLDVNALRGRPGEKHTVVHEAIRRGDLALLNTLLKIGNVDLNVKDMVWNGTPMGWAKALDKAAMVSVLEGYQESTVASGFPT